MRKLHHEVRDPIHSFIVFDNDDRKLINSEPMQRLKEIRQLAMTYQVYPGAVHNRFEHSLGVMEFACRIFDTVFRDEYISSEVRDQIGEELQDYKKSYWRNVVRYAALLHDCGHLPFSHAAESELLPNGWDHERITAEMIRHSEISDILKGLSPPIKPEDVVDVCWQPKKREKAEPEKLPDPWRALLNELITGDTFGADRIDYLLRDAYHAGVPYGRFGPDRLISGLRLVVDPETQNVVLGLQSGGIHSAEALLLARYFMYTSVYFHDVRRAYDLHLKEFLLADRPNGQFPTDWKEMVRLTDNEVMSRMRIVGNDGDLPGFEPARRILQHDHFQTVYELVSTHKERKPTILDEVFEFAVDNYGPSFVRKDSYQPASEAQVFWVENDTDNLELSVQVSSVIANIPSHGFGFVFAAPAVANDARRAIRNEFGNVFSGG